MTIAGYRNGGVSYDDLIVLTSWMADNGFDPWDIAYAVEKPWKYTEELARAKADAGGEPAQVLNVGETPPHLHP